MFPRIHINICMKNEISYWKALAQNMFLIIQGLFIATVIWDFFLTVIVPGSTRSHIFYGLSLPISIGIISIWIIGIFLMTGIFFTFILRENYTLFPRTINIEYIGIILFYTLLCVISFFNPVIVWPIILNYTINIIWAVSIICFKNSIQYGLELYNKEDQ